MKESHGTLVTIAYITPTPALHPPSTRPHTHPPLPTHPPTHNLSPPTHPDTDTEPPPPNTNTFAIEMPTSCHTSTLLSLTLLTFVPARVSGRALSSPAVSDDTATLTYLDGSAVHGARSRRADNVKGDTSALKIEFTIQGTAYVASPLHPLRFLVTSRSLVGCADLLKRGVGAPHQVGAPHHPHHCPLGSVASYLSCADVRTFWQRITFLKVLASCT